jgi:selenocysteine lyase/cysteine desulfurase
MTIKSIARHTFSSNEPNNASKYFDTASIGMQSETTTAFVNDRGANVAWTRAVDTVRRKFGHFLRVEREQNIGIYYNTTAAIQRVLVRLSRLLPHGIGTLLVTDIEYPGVFAAVEELWRGPVAVLQLSKLIWQPGGTTDELLLAAFGRALRLVKPTVLYFSHIARTSGYTLPVDAIVSLVRQISPRTFVFVDGAQAVGNITVPAKLLEQVDAYVTSGHKWLCGMTTLGLLYARDAPVWGFDDPAQSYSLKTLSSGSGVIDVLLSFQKALEDFGGKDGSRTLQIELHNRGLAERFVSLLDNDLFDVQGIGSRRNGIVAFQPQGYLGSKVADYTFGTMESEYLRLYGDKRFLIDAQDAIPVLRELNGEIAAETKGRNIRRASFHYYHSEEDVKRFADSLNLAAKAAQRKSVPDDRGGSKAAHKRSVARAQ